jgi:galactitol-specific phosphotransferase system IIB component
MALLKKFPSNFSKDIIDVFTLMTVPATFELELLGSSSLKISFASDFDTYTKVNVTEQSVSDFQQMIRNCLVYKQPELKRQKRTDKAVYVAGIKIGECLEFKVVADDCTKQNWNSKLPEMLKKVKSFLDKKIIDKSEYQDALKILKQNLTWADIIIAKAELNFQVIRWRPKDVIAGFVIYRTKKFLLKDCLFQKARVKVDLISWVGGIRYSEFSMIYKYYIDGKIIIDENTELERILKEQILTNAYSGNFMKCAKRILSLERFKKIPNKILIEKLMILFNSDLGRLSQIISDIENIIYIIENFSEIPGSPLPIARLKFETDQFKTRLSQITTTDYLKDENDIIEMLTELQTKPTDIQLLEALADELYDVVQRNTFAFLKKIKMWPIKPEYLPRQESKILYRKNYTPNIKFTQDIFNGVIS